MPATHATLAVAARAASTLPDHEGSSFVDHPIARNRGWSDNLRRLEPRTPPASQARREAARHAAAADA